MLTSLQLHLTRAFLKMYWRDPAALVLGMIIPVLMISIFAFPRVMGSQQPEPPEPIAVGIVYNTENSVAAEIVEKLSASHFVDVTVSDESLILNELAADAFDLVLELPEDFGSNLGFQPERINVTFHDSEIFQFNSHMSVLGNVLLSVERELRGINPMFSVSLTEDVWSGFQKFIGFLILGVLAFSMMQSALAGSGANIVEYRRKGILRRLFVSPVRARDFITAIALARTSFILIQQSLLILLAFLVLDFRIVGNLFSFYLVVILGALIFLCVGFFLGSLVKSQESIASLVTAVIMPQAFLSGAFYSVESLAEWLQPVAHLLPLSHVVTGMREIAIEGATLLEIYPSLIGIVLWLVISVVAATRFFKWKEVAS